MSWRRAVTPLTDWTVVANLPRFLKNFKEHAEGLYPNELETVQENIEQMFEAWTCPFSDIDVELTDTEEYVRNSKLFEFMGCLLENVLEVIDGLITELRAEDQAEEDVGEDLPSSEPLPIWERKAIAFYHGQVE